MKNTQNIKDQQSTKKKHSLSFVEYGAIFALVSVTFVVSVQLTEHSGYGAMNAMNAMNAMSLNAVTDTAIGDTSFKAD